MKVLAINTDWSRPKCEGKYGGVGWYRIINPFEKIGADVIRGAFDMGVAQSALDMRTRGDVWVIKPLDSIDTVSQLLANKDFSGAKLVVDFDDHPFAVDPLHPMKAHFEKTLPAIKMLIENADHIIVSTENLKKVLEKHNPRVTVIQNAIDTKIWEVKRKKQIGKQIDKRKDGIVRIGWTASASHMADIPLILEPMREVLRKYKNVEFHVCGLLTDDFQNDRVFLHEGTKGYEEFPQFLADLDIDIAIAPLKDSEFNESKSNIKWLESSMLEIPMVLSDNVVYKDVKNYKTGYLAKGTGQWVKYLSWLIESEDKRKEIGRSAKEEVLKNWTIEKQLPKYESLMKRLMPKNITVYTAITGGKDDLQEIPQEYLEEAEFVAFTEQESKTWETRRPCDLFKDERRNSRIQKILPHLYFDTKYTIYIDGNIHLKASPKELIEKYLKDKDIALFRHVGRDCLYEEAEACKSLGLDNVDIINEQQKAYLKRGVKLHGGLAECGMMIRRNTKNIQKWSEKWWAEYCRFSRRDQISFPVAFPMDKVELIEGNAFCHYGSKDFEIINHKTTL